MSLHRALKHLRLHILEDSGGIGVDWANISETDPEVIQLRWTNEELTSHIDIAQKQAARDTGCLKITDTMSVAANLSQISYPVDKASYGLLRARIVTPDARVLKVISTEEFRDQFDYMIYDGTTTSSKVKYIAPNDEEKIFQFYPPNLDAYTLETTCYKIPDALVYDPLVDVDLEIPVEMEPHMLNFAAYLAYNKEGPRTFDAQRSQYLLNLYREHFGFRNFYLQKQRARSGRRTIKYGGY